MKETLKLEDYPFTIRPLTDDEGGGYLIEYPDIPGCMSDGETPEEAIVNGRDALKCCLLALKEFGDPIPGTFASASGQWRQRVPKTLHAHLVERARREGVSLNTLVTAMIAEGLGNPAIGEQLSISVKTVEKHVASIFEKLGVRSRAQVAATVAREGRSNLER